MKKTFEKLSKLVGAKNAYFWMREAGKVDEKFVDQLDFSELEDVFDLDGREVNMTEKKSILELMSQKATNARELFKVYLVHLKTGNKEKAEYFLEKTKKVASLEDWAWIYRRYDFRTLIDKDCTKAINVAKEMIMRSVL